MGPASLSWQEAKPGCENPKPGSPMQAGGLRAGGQGGDGAGFSWGASEQCCSSEFEAQTPLPLVSTKPSPRPRPALR